MFRNQFYISNREIDDTIQFKQNKFYDLNIYSKDPLEVTILKQDESTIILIGYIVDPLQPELDNRSLIKRIIQNTKTKDDLFKDVQLLSGRFVIIFKSGQDYIALGDACNLRNLYYSFHDGNIILTSSQKMFQKYFDKDLIMSELKQKFIAMNEYLVDERFWFGDEGFDDRLKKVLPNHYLDLNDKTTKRIPIYTNLFIPTNEVLEYTKKVLVGNIGAIKKRFKVLQPITAGTDSRTLLAASREHQNDIQYYTFDISSHKDRPPDTWVPQNLSSKLGICYQLIRPGQLRKEFIEKYSKEHVFPRILPKLNQIQYHYLNYSDQKAVRICGFGGEIGRIRVGFTKYEIKPEMLRYFFGYEGKSEYVNKMIDKWAIGAIEYCKEYNLYLPDIFYWEQQMGNWGSQYPFEQDIAIEEFCPWYHKNLLFSIMRTDPKERGMYKSKFHHNLIIELWPEAMTEPINPGGLLGHVSGVLGRSTMFRYYKIKIKSKIHS